MFSGGSGVRRDLGAASPLYRPSGPGRVAGAGGARLGRVILSADHVITPGRILTPGWVRVDGGRVTETGEGGPPSPAERHHAGTLVPGFVDTHCHGGGGASFTSGDPDEARRVARAHLRHGTTSLVASLVTDEGDELERSVRALGDLVRDGLLTGIHLEGPWLSRDYCGAHEPTLVRPPSRREVDRLLAAGDGTVRMVTLAPELDGAIDAVRRIRDEIDRRVQALIRDLLHDEPALAAR